MKKILYEKLKSLVFISYCSRCKKNTKQIIYQTYARETYSLRCLECKRVKKRVYTPEMLLNCVERKEENNLRKT